jgi:hypothetical protein
MNIRRIRQLTLTVLACTLASIAPAIFGQTITGSITGTVSDASGAVVSGAKVTAVNTGTGVTSDTVANGSGIYKLPFLQIGQYKVTAEAPGFSPQTYGPFNLEVSQEAKVDIKLVVGSATQSVVVTEVAPILNTENAATGDTITAAAATEAPINSRNFSSLTTLVAGAISPNPQALNNVGRGQYNGGFFVNGNREQTNNYTLDGADINEAIDNYIGYSPNVDAIGEMRIITGNGTAEYGNANGGQVVMVTKSGTHHFHGNAFWFLENADLNANTWANKHVADPADIAGRGNFDRNMFGGTLGGPVLHNRLFFFIDYQGAREHSGGDQLRTVAPDSYRVNGYGGVAITNPVAQYLFANPSVYPLPTQAGTGPLGITNNYAGSYGTFTQNDQGDFKIDWTASPKDNVSGRMSIGRERDGFSKVSLPTDIPSNNSDPYTGFIVNWDHVFSPSLVNAARAGYGRTRYIQTPTDVDGSFGLTGNAKLGIPGLQLVPGISTFDASGTEGIDIIGAPPQDAYNGAYGGIDSDSIVNAFTYGDVLTWQKGKQTIKFGAQIIRYQENRYYSGNDGTLGWFIYSGGNNDSWSNFLTDSAYHEGQGALTGRWGQRQYRDAFFVQDDYKVLPNLTVNLGLRWEYDQPLYEVNNKQANVNIYNGAISYAGVDGASRALYNSFKGGFMPRIGFAYTPDRFGGKLVLRGGYGITNFLEGTGANLRLTLNPPFFVDASCNVGDSCAGGGLLHAADGFYRPVDETTFAGNVRAWQPNLKPALVQQYNLTSEYQLNNTTSLTFAYLGQVGDHLVDPREGNQRLSPTSPLPVSSLPDLGEVSVVSYTESESNMNYNAFQFTARKRYAQGLEFLADYTLSKSLSNNLGYYGAGGGGSASQSAYWQDAYNGAADYGPAFFDATNNVSISGYYSLPFGRGRQFANGVNRLTDEVIGGWKLGTIMSFHSGFPITVVDSTATYSNLVNARYARGNHYLPLKIHGRSANNWFGTDPSAVPCGVDENNGLCAYGAESSTGFGTASVGSERNPSYHDIDLALSKDFAITEGTHFEFRSDFFNVLNWTSLAPPTNDVSSSVFGQITNTVSNPRNIQLALKLVF